MVILQDELEDIRQFCSSISQAESCALLTVPIQDLMAAAWHVDATPGQSREVKTSALTLLLV